jgi:hypothetical protein
VMTRICSRMEMKGITEMWAFPCQVTPRSLRMYLAVPLAVHKLNKAEQPLFQLDRDKLRWLQSSAMESDNRLVHSKPCTC